MQCLLPLDEPERDERPRTISERFWDYHRRHPEVFEHLVRLAREYRAKRPGKRCSIDFLYHRLRWAFLVERDSAEEFTMNDHYTSRYARLLTDTFPEEFGGMFETRQLRAD